MPSLLRHIAPGRLVRPGALPLLASAVLALAAGAAPAVADDSQPTQWQLDARAEALQRAPEPAEKPVICVVDYGVNETPDLDIVSRTAIDGGTPDDVSALPGTYGHGTTVAHMAAGKVNGWGSSGVFPHARIASVRIFPRAGERVPWAGYMRGLEACWGLRPTPVVALLSLGGPDAAESEVRELENQLQRTVNRHDMSVVVAAGNGGEVVDMPGRIPAAFTVAAADGKRDLCSFSARGPAVDIAGPGCGLLQVGWNGAPWSLDGSSFSAPIVAGALAALRAYRPDLTATAAERLLITAASVQSPPLLDVEAALLASGLGHLSARDRVATAEDLVVLEGQAASSVPAPSRGLPVVRETGRSYLNAKQLHSRATPRKPVPPRVVGVLGRARTAFRTSGRDGLRLQVRIGRVVYTGKRSTVIVRRRVSKAHARLTGELFATPWTRVLIRRAFDSTVTR